MSILPWIMSAFTLAVMWLAGSRWRYTWHISLINQALWHAWILLSHQWGFLPMNVAMWFISIRNLIKWRKDL